jgi:hypothetical protein
MLRAFVRQHSWLVVGNRHSAVDLVGLHLGAPSHAEGLDFSHCCVRNRSRKPPLVTSTDDLLGTGSPRLVES